MVPKDAATEQKNNMKTLLAVMLNLLLFFPQLTFAQDENVCSKGEKCEYLYVATENPIFLDFQVVEGDKLPVYLGYFTLNENRGKLYFTNKSAFELEEMKARIPLLLKAGYIPQRFFSIPEGEVEKAADGAVVVLHYKAGKIRLFEAAFAVKKMLERGSICVLGLGNSFVKDYDALQPMFFTYCVYREDESKPDACRTDDPNFAPILRMVPHYGLDYCFPLLYDPLHKYTGYLPK